MTPDLSVSIINRCKTIRLEDSSGYGVDGWGPLGVDNTSVTEAKIYFVTGPTGSTSDPIDVTDAVTSADPLYGDFLLTGAAGIYPDGLYRLRYFLEYGGGDTAANVIEFWGYCNAEYGRDKMYAKYSQMLEDDAKEQYLDDAYNIDRLIRSMKSAISSVNINSLTFQQKIVDKILEFNNVPKAY